MTNPMIESVKNYLKQTQVIGFHNMTGRAAGILVGLEGFQFMGRQSSIMASQPTPM